MRAERPRRLRFLRAPGNLHCKPGMHGHRKYPSQEEVNTDINFNLADCHADQSPQLLTYGESQGIVLLALSINRRY
jgi:hypothetical protein